MLKQTHEALEKSIAKWTRIAQGTGRDGGRSNCALCEIFCPPHDGRIVRPIDKECLGCPIAETTGARYCRKIYDKRDSGEMSYKKWAEYFRDFLIGLRPKETKAKDMEAVTSAGGGGGGAWTPNVPKPPVAEMGNIVTPKEFWEIYHRYCRQMGKAGSHHDTRRYVDTVYIHCSATDKDLGPAPKLVMHINRWHKERGFHKIGYHAVIDNHGQIALGRFMNECPAAQVGFNTHSLAICFHGNLEFSEVQMTVLKKLWEEAPAYLRWRGHCEVSNKTCPNFDYKKVLNL